MEINVRKIKTIRSDKELSEKIGQFLFRRGFELGGGSIDEEGTVYIALQGHGQATYGPLGHDLKEFLKAPKLVLDGIAY